jgi:hypothetical protein
MDSVCSRLLVLVAWVMMMSSRGEHITTMSDGDGDWRSTFRPDIPSSARIYDYLLGGKDNFPVDREAAERLIEILPSVRLAARVNRAFVARAVRYLVNEAGITQLIDIGSGLPTLGNVHEIARNEDPAAHVVYVDHDPVVLAHVRDVLSGENGVTIVSHDMRDPKGILDDPQTRQLIDFDRPAGILLVSMLHFLADADDPAGIIRQLLEPFPPGSHVALTHSTSDATPRHGDVSELYRTATTDIFPRPRDEVLALVNGLDLVDPGLVWTPLWHPDPKDPAPQNPSSCYYYALMARTRNTTRLSR